MVQTRRILPPQLDAAALKTFAQALKDKYVDQEEFDNNFVLPKDKIISTDITLVGFGKVTTAQRQLRNLISIDLSGKSINSLGEFHDLFVNLKRVRILNLANNYLGWKDVSFIVSQLPNLRELILCGNSLYNQELYENQLTGTVGEIHSLSLGRINRDWKCFIATLSRIWTRIHQLDLWDNQLDGSKMTIGQDVGLSSFVSGLQALKLSCNNFVDIAWIAKAGPLDSLQELDLSRCKLSVIEINDDMIVQLNKLNILNVSYNELHDWKSISQLYKLPALVNLICNENPLYISDKMARTETIGRLRGLKILNREEITPNQRRDTEISYFKKVFPEYQKYLKTKNEEFKLLHPSYDELIQFYGIPEDLLNKQVADDHVNLELRYGDRREIKRFKRNLRIVNLKMLCKKHFGIKLSSVVKLTSYDKEPSESVISYELDKDGQTLDFFSVEDNYIIVIVETER